MTIRTDGVYCINCDSWVERAQYFNEEHNAYCYRCGTRCLMPEIVGPPDVERIRKALTIARDALNEALKTVGDK